MADYTTPSKHQTENLPHCARRCAICLAEELQFGPYPVLDCGHDADICIRPGQVSEGLGAYGIDQNSRSLLRYCPSKTWAFSLAHRSWREVRVTDLHDVVYPDVSKTELYMLPTTKQLFDSLVESYLAGVEPGASTSSRRHVERNVLLQGDPGSGKTFIVGTSSLDHNWSRTGEESG